MRLNYFAGERWPDFYRSVTKFTKIIRIVSGNVRRLLVLADRGRSISAKKSLSLPTKTLIMSKNTIQSISEQTGYSVSTVSRVLSGKAQRSRISQKTIDIIRAEAKRVNYTPNLLAQGLRTSRTFTIGLTVPGIDNPFFATLAATVIENLKLAGYHTLLADSLENQ